MTSARPEPSPFRNRSVLVTGGTGFLGFHLLHRLHREGARISLLVRDVGRLGHIEPLRPYLRLIEHDLSALSALRMPDEEVPSWVFHLAAAGVERPTEEWEQAIEANVRGTANLLHWCSSVPHADSRSSSESDLEGDSGESPGLRAFVYTGTPFEYVEGAGPRAEDVGLHAPNFYAASKAAGWLFCQAFSARCGLPIVGARPFSAYGPHQGEQRFVPHAIISALANRDIEMTGGEQKRDFVFVDDIVDGLLRAAASPRARGEMFNLGTGAGVTLRHVVERILHLTGSHSRALFGRLPYREGERMDLHADARKAHRVLGWQARTGLDDGLQATIDWYKANHVESRKTHF